MSDALALEAMVAAAESLHRDPPPFAATTYAMRIHPSWFETIEQRTRIAALLARADELDRG